MLILSRKANETIMIGDDVKLTVISIRDSKVKIAVKQLGVQNMLHTLKINEPLLINEDIKVMVTVIRAGQARIGTEAPRSKPIHRQEIYDRIQMGKELSKITYRKAFA